MTTALLSSEDSRWIKMVEADPHATIFNHPAWLKLLADCYGYQTFVFGNIANDGELLAGLPIASRAGISTRRSWTALPFSDYCQPLYTDVNAERQLFANLLILAKQRSVEKLEIRCAAGCTHDFMESQTYLMHSLPLCTDICSVAKRVHRQQMHNVHLAENNQIQLHYGTGLPELKEFYRLHTLSRHKHGVPVQPWHFFRRMSDLLLTTGLGFVLLAYQGQKCISAGLFLNWNKTLTYKYSATDENSFCLRPNHLVTWSAMVWGCEHGYTLFDFGRADKNDAGLCSYKRRWGADETPLLYSYFPRKTNSILYEQGNLSAAVRSFIRKSPVWVTRLSGEILYRYFN